MTDNKFDDKKLTTREDFLWGVNMHSSYYSPSYKVSTIEDRIHYAAEMGCKLMRLNANSPEDELDYVVRLCNSYGMKVMLVIYIKDVLVKQTQSQLKEIEKEFFYYTDRYDGLKGFGKADFIQISNEMDLTILSNMKKPDYPTEFDKVEDYDCDILANATEQVKAAIKGVKSSTNEAKTVINFCWEHYGMLTYFYENGVDWDIIGHDWYGDMMNAYETRRNSTAYGIGELLYKKYGKQIIICESNYFQFDLSNQSWDDTKAETYDILIRGMQDAYRQNYVIGYTIYELVDELCFEKAEWKRGDETWYREGHFGLLFADREGNIIEPKPIYYRIKDMIGGKNQPKKLIK